MSIILSEAEKVRLINVFQAFAMNIYESLMTCLQKSDGVIWVCTMVVWVLTGQELATSRTANERRIDWANLTARLLMHFRNFP